MVEELFMERVERTNVVWSKFARLTVPLLSEKMQIGAFQDGSLLILEMILGKKKRSYVKVATYLRTTIKMAFKHCISSVMSNFSLQIFFGDVGAHWMLSGLLSA